METREIPQVAYRELDLFAIPSYVYKGLLARGSSLAKLDEAISKDEIKINRLDQTKEPTGESKWDPTETEKFLREYLSGLDVESIRIATDQLHQLINFNMYSDLKETHRITQPYVSRLVTTQGYQADQSVKELIESLSDLTINMRIIDNDMLDRVLQVEVVNNHVYAIIHKGFFNFKLFNNSEFKSLVVNGLLFHLFRFFDPEQIRKSNLFLSLVLNF